MARVSWPVKWIIGPALAVALGYSVVGPRYAGKIKIPDVVKEGVQKLAPGIGKPKDETVAPHVSVGVKPVEESSSERRSRRSR